MASISLERNDNSIGLNFASFVYIAYEKNLGSLNLGDEATRNLKVLVKCRQNIVVREFYNVLIANIPFKIFNKYKT